MVQYHIHTSNDGPNLFCTCTYAHIALDSKTFHQSHVLRTILKQKFSTSIKYNLKFKMQTISKQNYKKKAKTKKKQFNFKTALKIYALLFKHFYFLYL